MSTPSTITYVDENNIAHSIYCHHDGYTEHHMPILTKHYNSYEKAKELVDLGDMSVLEIKVHPDPKKEHKFGYPNCAQNDVCLYYHRDRGDDWEQCKPSEYEYTKEGWINTCGQDYNYIFVNNKWYCNKNELRK